MKVTDAVGVAVYNFLLTDDHYQLQHVTSERHIFTFLLQERGKCLGTKDNNEGLVCFGGPVCSGPSKKKKKGLRRLLRCA